MVSSFISAPLQNGVIFPEIPSEPTSSLSSWVDSGVRTKKDCSHIGYVFSGEAVIHGPFSMNTASSGMYFAFYGEGFVGGKGSGIIISQQDYRVLPVLGGPLESWGRLRYIDGCTDTLLIPPVLKGDPCFNALFFPKGIFQTQHTHPSVRVGMVVSGKGRCITPEGNIDLEPGNAFIIIKNGLHSFETEDSHLTVVAYHPDSDFGPTHENHPMINRTIVNGVSASVLDDIRTK